MKLDIGCGSRKQEGFVGVDSIAFDGVDVVADLNERWPFDDNSVDEAYASHVIEHFTGVQRVHFVNELYRVLKPDAKALLIFPHWGSGRAYGDPTHQWPPMSEFWFNYLSQAWRDSQAPHTDAKHWPQGYNCNFECTWGYSLHPIVQAYNYERQKDAVDFHKEAIQDVGATLIRR